MRDYSRLREFLGEHRENEISLTLRQIEIIIDGDLPPSARNYRAWWSSPSSHPHVRNWSSIGWTVEVHSEKGENSWVIFRKSANK